MLQNWPYGTSLKSLCAFDKNNIYCVYGFAGLADGYIMDGRVIV